MPEFMTWKSDGEVEIVVAKEGLASRKPETIIEAFQNTLDNYENEGALHVKVDGDWKVTTWREYHNQCRAFAKSLIHIGMDRFEAVSVIGFNSPEWLIADVGCIFAGGFAAGIYTTNNPSSCHYIAEHAGARVVVCDGVHQLEKFLSIADKLPKLKALVVYNDEVPENVNSPVPVYTFENFLELGQEVPDEKLQDRLVNIRPGHCSTLIYTSGTTGNPKAVMISHDNITWTVHSVCKMLGDLGTPITAEDRLVSYLPLSHIAAQLIDLHLPICSGAKLYFAQPDALKGSLGHTLKDVRPTRFLGVPRVWEKIAEKMWEIGKQTTGIKKRIAEWAKDKGFQKTQLAQYGNSGGAPCGYGCAHALVLSKIKEALGLDQCVTAVVGAAPVSLEVLNYFGSLDIPIFELFGQSECTGPQSLCLQTMWKIGTVGKAIPGTEWKVIDETQELCFRGRNRMMGYLNSEKQTKEAIDDEGWLHSGDCAKIDDDGFASITGRIKELIITAGGENIPPTIIEDVIKEELPMLSNVMVIGDKRKFLSALFTFRVTVDQSGNPTQNLDKRALDVCEEIGSSAKTVAEAKACAMVKEYILKGVTRANSRATSQAQRVSKYEILENDFSQGLDELTPTLKLKRKVVMERYEQLIDSIYAEKK